jgi:threonine/homoserine/homoserine lactone efflux protein
MLMAMIIFALVGAATPGPVNLLATSTAVRFGLSVALKHVVGASIAYAFVVFATGSVLHQISMWLPKLELLMQLIGSAFLSYLAYKIYTAPVSSIELEHSAPSSWSQGALLQLLNPKAWLVAMSGVSLYVIGQIEQQKWLWLYTLVSLIACLIGVGLWAFIGSLFARYLQEPSRQRAFNRTMAMALQGTVLMIWI